MFGQYFLSAVTFAAFTLTNAGQVGLLNENSIFNGAEPLHKNTYATAITETPEVKSLTEPKSIQYIQEYENNGEIVPAQLTSYEWGPYAADGTFIRQDMLEVAVVDKRLTGGTVEFYNTGYKELDGLTFEMHDTGGAVDYRSDQYSSTGKSYVFDICRTEALEYIMGDSYQAFLEQGRLRGCKAIVHLPNGCTYTFEFHYGDEPPVTEDTSTDSQIEGLESEVIETPEEVEVAEGFENPEETEAPMETVEEVYKTIYADFESEETSAELVFADFTTVSTSDTETITTPTEETIDSLTEE
jgi:hypothetical protein